MNCKYCGAEMSENDRYCPACGSAPGNDFNTAADVLTGKDSIQNDIQEDAYSAADTVQSTRTSTQVEIPENTCGNTDASAENAGVNLQETGTQDIKNILQRAPVSLTLAIKIIAIVLCCAGLIGIGTCIRTKTLEGQLRRAKSDYSTAAAAVEDLNSQLSDAQTELETVQAENDTLTEQVSSLNDQVTTMEGDITQYQYDASAAQQDAEYAAGQVAALNETVTGLETDLATANETNETLQSDYDTLAAEKEALEGSNAALTEENEAYEQKIAFYDQYVVFVMVDDKNKYYHTYDCTEFTKKNFLAYSVKLAEMNNYTPCPVCQSGTTSAAAAAVTATPAG